MSRVGWLCIAAVLLSGGTEGCGPNGKEHHRAQALTGPSLLEVTTTPDKAAQLAVQGGGSAILQHVDIHDPAQALHLKSR